MKKFLFFSLIIQLVIGSSLYSQQRTASIVFTEEAFDFGKIKETDGNVTHVFHFSNTGSVPLVLQDVRASCGCTSPEWTKQPIMPGAKGFVKATFNPTGRPGAFDKSITVISNADRSSIILKITGMVLPKPPTIEDEYRFAMGDVRLMTNFIFFGKVNPASKVDTTIEMINTGKVPAEIKFAKLPVMIKAEAKPNVLGPGQKGKIFIDYNVAQKNDWGFHWDDIKLAINNKEESNYAIKVSVDIQEDFSKLTPEQMANAPVLKFNNVVYDFGTVKEGQKIEHEFTFKNEGKTDLIFRKFESSCGCTTVNPAGTTIKPGATSTIKVIFDTTGKKNKQEKTVTVVSNDPRNPRLMLRMTGMIE